MPHNKHQSHSMYNSLTARPSEMVDAVCKLVSYYKEGSFKITAA